MEWPDISRVRYPFPPPPSATPRLEDCPPVMAVVTSPPKPTAWSPKPPSPAMLSPSHRSFTQPTLSTARPSFSKQSRASYRTRTQTRQRFENIYEEGDHQPMPAAVTTESNPEYSTSPGRSGNQRRRLYYAVRQGHKPGVYRTWEEAEEQFKGYPDPRWQTFRSPISAQEYVSGKSCFNDRKWQEAIPDPFFQGSAEEIPSQNMPLQDRLTRDFSPTPPASAPSVLLPPLQPPRPNFAQSPSSPRSEVKRSSPLRQSMISSEENVESEDKRASVGKRSLFSRFSMRGSSQTPTATTTLDRDSVAKTTSSDRNKPLPRGPSARSTPRSFTSAEDLRGKRKSLWGDVFLEPSDESGMQGSQAVVEESISLGSPPKFSRATMKKANVVLPLAANSRPPSVTSSPTLSPKASHTELQKRSQDHIPAAESLHERLLALAAEDELAQPPKFGIRSRSSSAASSLGPPTPPLHPMVSRESGISTSEGSSGLHTSSSSILTHAHSDDCSNPTIKPSKSHKRKSGLSKLMKALKLSSTADDDSYMQSLADRRGSA